MSIFAKFEMGEFRQFCRAKQNVTFFRVLGSFWGEKCVFCLLGGNLGDLPFGGRK